MAMIYLIVGTRAFYPRSTSVPKLGESARSFEGVFLNLSLENKPYRYGARFSAINIINLFPPSNLV